jgi:hypothetical protein
MVDVAFDVRKQVEGTKQKSDGTDHN